MSDTMHLRHALTNKAFTSGSYKAATFHTSGLIFSHGNDHMKFRMMTIGNNLITWTF